MNEGRKNNVSQIAILVVLAGVLLFAVFKVLLPQMNANKARQEKRAASRASSGEAARTDNGVTEMPVVPTTSGAGSAKSIARVESEYRLNPNQFRVFQIDPPKNPFAQKEAWYSDTLNTLPGYPELRDNGYFENDSTYLPTLPEVTDPGRDWRKVVIERSRSANSIEINGDSKDGSIHTSVAMNEGKTGSERIEWTPGLGIPLSALTKPGWEQQYPEQAAIMRGLVAAPKETDDTAADGLDNSSDLFVGDNYSGLGLPGSGAPDDALRDGSSEGDSIACSGVNRQGRRSSAIMVLNGKSYIVSEGSVLPTHYQVLEIKDDGVVITDLKDGSSRWIEISAAERGERKAKPGKAQPAGDEGTGDGSETETVIAPSDLPVFVR